MRTLAAVLFAAALLLACVSVQADTVANCTYDDALGTWQVSLSAYQPAPTQPSLQCDWAWPTADIVEATLTYPNVATLANGGGVGNWTLIYNQGIEVCFLLCVPACLRSFLLLISLSLPVPVRERESGLDQRSHIVFLLRLRYARE
jgi:hypothetical protein